MDSGYDEIIVDNIFYSMLMRDYRDLFLKCVVEGCILCVPRAGIVSKYSLTFEDFCAHILIPSYELPESHFLNVNGEEVRISNRVITVDHDIGHQSSIHILFEETFYTEDDLKYKVLCIEKPIEGKKIISNGTSRVTILTTLRECIDFLWLEGGSVITERITQLTTEFLRTNHAIENGTLENLIDITHSLYVRCVQTALKCTRIRKRLKSDKCLMSNVTLAVESCMHHNIYSKIIKDISTYTAQEDAHLNKILRNLSSLQIQDLEIRNELYDVIPNAKFELSKIDGYSTVLGKSGCLKKMFLIISNYSKSKNVVGTDDILQILIFLVIKIGLPNWNAQLKYLKLFRFSVVPEIQDEICFLITSLEAAIEHIESEMLINPSDLDGKNIAETLRGNQNFHLRSTLYKLSDEQTSVQNFFKAVSLGNLEQVKSIINKEDNLGSESSFIKLCHPLCSCSRCKSLTSNYKENFPTVNSCNSQGLTALHLGAVYCKSTIVEFLLANGADPNKSDFDGLTAMHYAAMRGHQNGLLLLAYAGADVNALDYSQNSPLHFCSNNGHENCVKALIYFCENSGLKLNINAQNSSGDSPLHNASRWGYLNIVQILLENGGDPTIRNKRKLSSIDVAHNSKILELLTRPMGMVQNYIRIVPFRPMFDHLEDATHDSGSKQIIKGIVPSSKDALKKVEKTLRAIADADNHLTCFYLGLDTSELDSEADIKITVDESPSVTEKCHPLCRCSKCDNSSSDDNQEEIQPKNSKTDCVNINSCNPEGFTLLHSIAVYGRTELCRVLIRNGALLNVQTLDTLMTPLMLAAQYQRHDIVKLLLKHGCNIDMQDHKGNTALHHACRTRNAKIVEALIEYDPDLNLRNHENKTALQEAKENMSFGVIKAIKGRSSLGTIDGLVNHQSQGAASE